MLGRRFDYIWLKGNFPGSKWFESKNIYGGPITIFGKWSNIALAVSLTSKVRKAFLIIYNDDGSYTFSRNRRLLRKVTQYIMEFDPITSEFYSKYVQN